MYLKSIEIQGFKSFPDKTVLTFGPGITGVVGPNGSGKSNISDAVRWVLGEQSTKSLRGAKMEDVIFSGTGSRKAVGFAEVTLRLDNADGLLQNPEKEVSVTRRYYRSGESAYLINGKASRLRDVNELFMDTGLGRDGYSMVGQGRIEEMVSAKSENRREMFEEAAGISHLRYRRADANKRLQLTEENLVRLRDIVEELRSRVGPLEKQSIKAQQFLKLAAERKELEIGLWLRILETSAEKIREQAGKLDVAKAQYDETGAALERLNEEIEGAGEKIRELNVRMEAVRADSAALEDEVSALDAETAVTETSIQHNAETVERLTREIAMQDGVLSQTETDRQAILARVAELDAAISAAEKELDGLTARLGSLKSRDEEYSEESARANEALAAVTAEISRVGIERQAALSYTEEIRSRLGEVGAAAEKRRENGKELTDRLSSENARLKELSDRISEMMNMKAGFALKLQTSERKLEEKKTAYENERLKLLSMQSRLKFLRDTEKNMEGYGGAVKVVMREKSHGTLKGIRGTLFQLIEVDAEYTTAIETALGNAVQDIVTETENDAKKAIAYLKNANAGRATFLPLSAVKGKYLDEKGLEDRFGFVGVASDLVKYDAEYEGVVRSLLGRVAVCEDLDTALPIAKAYGYRFRIVTLDGQVINAGGSMTGGSKISSAGFFTRRAEAQSLEKDEAKLQDKLAVAAAALKTDTEALSRRRAETGGLEADILRATEEKSAALSAKSVTDSLIEENARALEELARERDAAEERLKNFTDVVSLADEKLAELEKDRALREKAISDLSGGHDDLVSDRERLNEEIGAVNVKTVALLGEKRGKTDQLEELSRRDAEVGETKERLRAEIAGAEAHGKELVSSLEDSKKRAANLREKIAENAESVQKLIEKRTEAEKTASDGRLLEKQKNEEREKLSGELVRLEERRNALVKEQEDTERRLYEEYSLTRREAAEIAEPTENPTAARSRLSELRAAIKALGNVNVAAIDEYKEVSARYDFLSAQVEDVEKSKKELTRMIEELTGKMAELFRERFDAINGHFRTTFTELFGGGEASLVLEDENDILECGITIRAQPPGKNVRNLSLLSGGEKGLTAVALLFAILKVRPAPFCVFDEVEAALDDVNVVRYAQYVRSMTDNIQFILITHRRGTMEEADILYGVTMQEHGVSKLLELRTAEMVAELHLDE
ncbi:MAG: chromosome segregation protein SMC [Clostridia bacterium]|nr:chromosome segregation protein SMC [Clostridia bacterium]